MATKCAINGRQWGAYDGRRQWYGRIGWGAPHVRIPRRNIGHFHLGRRTISVKTAHPSVGRQPEGRPLHGRTDHSESSRRHYAVLFLCVPQLHHYEVN